MWIDIPLDVQAAQVDPEQMKGFQPEPEVDDSATIANGASRALDLLVAARRPVILVGNGVRIAGAQETFLELVQRLGVPVLTTRPGVDLIPFEHELCCGMPGVIASRAANFTLQNSDCLLILGARMDFALIAYAPHRLAPGARKVMVNIDPAEIRKLGNTIDVPVAADVARFLEAMLAHSHHLAVADRTAWLEQCRHWKAKYPFALPPELVKGDGLSMYDFSAALSHAMSDDDVVLPGNSGFAARSFSPHYTRNRANGSSTTKARAPWASASRRPSGPAWPAEAHNLHRRRRRIPAQHPGTPDSSPAQFTGQVLCHKQPGLRLDRASQNGYFKHLVGADATSGLTLPDHVKVAAAYGLASLRIDGPEDMPSKLQWALASPGPVVCEVMVKADEPRAPRVSSMQKPDGSMELCLWRTCGRFCPRKNRPRI